MIGPVPDADAGSGIEKAREHRALTIVDFTCVAWRTL
jgi:hypothetical protein